MDDLTGLGIAREQETCVRAEQLTHLIDVLASLRDPDRCVDALIAAIFWPDRRSREETSLGMRLDQAVDEVLADQDYDYLATIADDFELAELTELFDVALTLVPKTAVFTLNRLADGSYYFAMAAPDGDKREGMGAWPAVAVLVAVLRSMLAKEAV